jgi:hypothetical protein
LRKFYILLHQLAKTTNIYFVTIKTYSQSSTAAFVLKRITVYD